MYKLVNSILVSKSMCKTIQDSKFLQLKCENLKEVRKNNRNRSDMICQNSKAGNFNAKISVIAYKQTTYTDQFTTY